MFKISRSTYWQARFHLYSGKWIRFSTRKRNLDDAKGKFSVEVAAPAELVSTLELIKSAIEAGELDIQLEATAGSVRSGFQR